MDVSRTDAERQSSAPRAPARRVPVALVAALAAAAALLVAAVLLWAHYGTAVFFEMIAAGIAACF
ncbi:hypothetical protein [Bradyrhizobium sp. LHD-71]|uniref:hypothetical protein n=1 Tax=Bradyrhizobium sp. LHD-71 TaxID=3072141 RepID=UPI002810456B|nr:hypothetical protein [Bradyrhizobium sp. LHD-71]MDQ8730350.1 hypothetical protein [Bradyrhizobium sp. LHD-71]